MKKTILTLLIIMLLTAVSCSFGVEFGNVHSGSKTYHFALKQFSVPGTESNYYVCYADGEFTESETFASEHLHRLDENGECLDCNKIFNTDHFDLVYIFTFEVDDVPCAGLYRSKTDNCEIVKSIAFQDINIPIVCLEGDLSEATKEKTVEVIFSFYNNSNPITSNGTVKIQGSNSTIYPKKNYSLKLDNKVKIVDSWGKQKKYCLKANYVDYSQLRNVVSAKLFGKIVKSRGIEDDLNDLINGGAVDGFPVIIFNNGSFLGLYTFNIPKDKWLFGMKDSDSKDKAILMADTNNSVVFMEDFLSLSFDNGMELEFASNEESSVDNDTSWVAQSFNQLIGFVQNNDGQNFVDGISDYTDISRCIDVLIYTHAIGAADNKAKNIIWVTFDGTKWYPSMYDMDGVFGLYWDGSIKDSASYLLLDEAPRMLLWKRLYTNFYPEICARYSELRENILSLKSIEREFKDFSDKIPSIVYEAEKQKWTEVPNQDTNNINQILAWAADHFALMDDILTTEK